MPKSKNTRKPTTSKNAVQGVLEKARVLDRRRQAQIENQKESINRLLARFDDARSADALQLDIHVATMMPTSHAVYNEEMGILHGAYADAAAEVAELRDTLTGLVEVVDQITPTGEIPDALDDALAQARAHVAPSVAQTTPEASQG